MLQIYEMILKKNPNNTQILKLIGALELQCKNFTKSIHYLDKAIKSKKQKVKQRRRNKDD